VETGRRRERARRARLDNDRGRAAALVGGARRRPADGCAAASEPDQPLAALEGAGALPRPAPPRRALRRPRQRPAPTCRIRSYPGSGAGMGGLPRRPRRGGGNRRGDRGHPRNATPSPAASGSSLWRSRPTETEERCARSSATVPRRRSASSRPAAPPPVFTCCGARWLRFRRQGGASPGSPAKMASSCRGTSTSSLGDAFRGASAASPTSRDQPASRRISFSVRSDPGQCSRSTLSPLACSKWRRTSAATIASSSWPAMGMKSGMRSKGNER
jgi:hypothetical protein